MERQTEAAIEEMKWNHIKTKNTFRQCCCQGTLQSKNKFEIIIRFDGFILGARDCLFLIDHTNRNKSNGNDCSVLSIYNRLPNFHFFANSPFDYRYRGIPLFADIMFASTEQQNDNLNIIMQKKLLLMVQKIHARTHAARQQNYAKLPITHPFKRMVARNLESPFVIIMTSGQYLHEIINCVSRILISRTSQLNEF